MTNVFVTGGNWSNLNDELKTFFAKQPELAVACPRDYWYDLSLPRQDIDAVVVTSLYLGQGMGMEDWVQSELVAKKVPFILLETAAEREQLSTPREITQAASARFDFWEIVNAVREATTSTPESLEKLVVAVRGANK